MSARVFSIVVVCVLLAVLAAASSSAQVIPQPSSSPSSPNFVVLQTDDLSYAMVERLIKHYPEIQRLKNNRADFARSYVTNSLCCPSRATFLTGRYSHNTGK
jgi:N-acetylglucosamine-6-sulfatase